MTTRQIARAAARQVREDVRRNELTLAQGTEMLAAFRDQAADDDTAAIFQAELDRLCTEQPAGSW